MQNDRFTVSVPGNSSFLGILGKLFGAAATGAFLSLITLGHNHALAKPSDIPKFVVGFAAVGFCAGLLLVLNDLAQRGIERSKSQGKPLGWWKLLRVFAFLLILPIVIGLCILWLLWQVS